MRVFLLVYAGVGSCSRRQGVARKRIEIATGSYAWSISVEVSAASCVGACADMYECCSVSSQLHSSELSGLQIVWNIRTPGAGFKANTDWYQLSHVR